MNMRPYIFVLFFSGIFLAVPFVTGAQGLVSCSRPDCQACDLTRIASSITNWLLGIAGVIGGLLFLYAGVLLVVSRGNPGALGHAKGIIVAVVIGLIVAGSAWLIVDTMLSVLTKRGGIKNWKVQCVDQPPLENSRGVIVPPGSPNPGTPVSGPGPGAGPGSEVGVVDTNKKLTEAEARAAFTAAGIGIASDISKLEGVSEVAVNEIIALKQACGCDITVTSTTGGIHSTTGPYTHANGYKIDLRSRDNPELTSFIENNYTNTGIRGDGAQTYTDGCTIYALEDNPPHWDVQVKPGC